MQKLESVDKTSKTKPPSFINDRTIGEAFLFFRVLDVRLKTVE